MRRRRVDAGYRDTAARLRKGVDLHRGDRLDEGEFMRRRFDAHVVEPDDPPFAVRDFRPIAIVRLEMPVGDGPRVAGIGLVEMFWRSGSGREDEGRSECESEPRAPR
ncbi:MAG: hypothetical protein A3G76_08215 [Acidobacteria bacterium RIFCSPLOWO2_12_FULL_65_11]|nr:MAG: hypothetical protein A3G76_08215 [Acidobacteria bacterium RIFCSPLOWO2_12_FULL_65_11]